MKLAAAALVAASLAACSSHAPPAADRLPDGEARQLLIDRNWIDRMPASKTDKLHVYRFVPDMGGGVFQDRTLYKGVFELFHFAVRGDTLRFALPETNERVDTTFSIEKIAEPKPFDLKLTIAHDPRGPGVYYGVRAEHDAAALDQLGRLPVAPSDGAN